MRSNNQRGRIEIIDRELSQKGYVKTTHLVQVIEDELDINCSVRTVQKDIELMQRTKPMGYEAPIDYDEKKKAYYYTDPNFTIQAFGLIQEDIMALLFYVKTLEQYKGFAIFDKILQAIEKILSNFKMAKRTKELIANRTLIQTEKFPVIKGIEFIEPILKGIIEKRIIQIEYKKFDDLCSKTRELLPVLLKEDKNFWYVIGLTKDKNTPTTFALDRISNLLITNKNATPPRFDSEQYFRYSFGITVSEEEPVEIVLSFNPFQGKYIKTVPIHQTQTIITDNEEEFKICIKIKPSYEFYSKILSYGSDVKIISPDTIADKVKQQILEAFQRY